MKVASDTRSLISSSRESFDLAKSKALRAAWRRLRAPPSSALRESVAVELAMRKSSTLDRRLISSSVAAHSPRTAFKVAQAAINSFSSAISPSRLFADDFIVAIRDFKSR